MERASRIVCKSILPFFGRGHWASSFRTIIIPALLWPYLAFQVTLRQESIRLPRVRQLHVLPRLLPRDRVRDLGVIFSHVLAYPVQHRVCKVDADVCILVMEGGAEESGACS
ncbi:hypothetical protein BC938DRAFT_477948 [Jimgerdemannia flammicorona]|uniref:Uncharacterized protein n=1 Tax=Jimgerdemannia flammicorona TaxID=994334 RepID=A0A433P743_9FUNG|nr:hypothetical protein BC938DRAFT_477948 [Jimgerdemannia flammicorona]